MQNPTSATVGHSLNLGFITQLIIGINGPKEIFDGSGMTSDGPGEILDGPGEILDGHGEILYGPGEILDGPGMILHGPGEILGRYWMDLEKLNMDLSRH